MMMTIRTATAISYSNIALIKYWGNRDEALRLPANGSISMNLDGLETVTTVTFRDEQDADSLVLNGSPESGEKLARVQRHLDHIRRMAGTNSAAQVNSENNFPTGTGIASSASAFSALTVAACAALGLDITEQELSALARLGSGSACRSVPGGFVEWHAGHDHGSSFAESIAPPDHWEMVDLIAVVSQEHKAVGSTGGHALAGTSPLQRARVEGAPARLDACRAALLARDFAALAEVIEQDALLMHAVMMTSRPALIYWHPPTLGLMEAVTEMRQEGLPVCYTIDAGPNVHVLTLDAHREAVEERLRDVAGVSKILVATAGGAARVIASEPN